MKRVFTGEMQYGIVSPRGVTYFDIAKVKYKVLAGSFAGRDQTQRTYPHIDVQELLTNDGVDLRRVIPEQFVEEWCLDDYFKQTNGEGEE